MTDIFPGLAELARRDPRYAYQAYAFVLYAVHHTEKRLGREPPPDHGGRESPPGGEPHHVSGPELLDGIRDLALCEFGRLARTVFRLWGIERTDDFGEIVFNLIEGGLLSKTDKDDRSDFRGVYDLDQALVEGFQFRLDGER